MICFHFPVWDGEFLIWLQTVTKNPVFDWFFPFYTQMGNAGIAWILIGLILLIPKKTRTSGGILLVSLLLTHLTSTILLKNLVGRPRPYINLPGVRLLIGPQDEFSFPSGHAASSFACAMVLFFREKGWLKYLPFVAAILMGFSRLYVGVHYPLDVACGALIGTCWAALLVWGQKKISQKLNSKQKIRPQQQA